MPIYVLLRLVAGKPFLFDQNEEICLSVSLDNVCLFNIKGFIRVFLKFISIKKQFITAPCIGRHHIGSTDVNLD